MKREIKIGDKLRVVDVSGLHENDSLKIGQILECTDLTNINLSNGYKGIYANREGFYYSHRFEIVEDYPEKEMIEQIAHAKSLIGKNVKLDGTYRLITFAGVAFAKCGRLSSSVNSEINAHGFCVYIRSEDGYVKPAKFVEHSLTSINVKLNDSYDAVVTEKTIKVGCQVFSVNILSELVAAHKKITLS